MEPMLPDKKRGQLADLTVEAIQKIGRLSGQIHSAFVRKRIAELVRSMNCYYSNLIEGHRTVPKDIERALKQDFSREPKKRDNQLLSKAHIETERAMFDRLQEEQVQVFSSDFICWLHESFYAKLPESLHLSKDKAGKAYPIKSGKFRDHMVKIGAHEPPHHDSVDAFMQRFCDFYGGEKIIKTNRLIAIAAAHRRLAWVHPFADGNGRVGRLHSQAALYAGGWHGDGLWTLARGFSRRRRGKYFKSLHQADQTRLSDLDGRGNLSDQGLAEFCVFFIETIIDQMDFMSEKLDIGSLRKRVEKTFQFEDLGFGSYNEGAMKVARVLIDEGEIARGQVQGITGKKETYSRELIARLLKTEIATSPSPKGLLQVNFPTQILDSYFPRLYLDALG